jgi:hypothetical protein
VVLRPLESCCPTDNLSAKALSAQASSANFDTEFWGSWGELVGRVGDGETWPQFFSNASPKSVAEMRPHPQVSQIKARVN